jgi:hypothetical protein
MANFGSFQHNFDAPYGLGVVSGRFPKLHGVQKFGYNPAVPSNAVETVWDGSSLYVYPDAADYVEVVCDDGTNDVDGGTGARSVTIEGLDANYNKQSETITLTNPDSAGVEGRSVNQYIRLFRAYVATAGSQQTNDDDINFYIGDTNVALIKATVGQTLMAVYTVPAGFRAYVVQLDVGSAKDLEHEISLVVRNGGNAWNTQSFITMRGGFIEKGYEMPIVIDEMYDVEIRAISSATSAVSAGFELLLEKK